MAANFRALIVFLMITHIVYKLIQIRIDFGALEIAGDHFRTKRMPNMANVYICEQWANGRTQNSLLSFGAFQDFFLIRWRWLRFLQRLHRTYRNTDAVIISITIAMIHSTNGYNGCVKPWQKNKSLIHLSAAISPSTELLNLNFENTGCSVRTVD